MSMKKILCLVMALALCAVAAFAEGEDLQSQLDAANARIAELEGEVELYKPYYDAQVITEYDGGIIFLEDVLEEYAYIESMYAQYGVSLADYGLEAQYKQAAAESLLQNAVMDAKAAELGLDQLDDETLAGLTEEAAANFETYITSVSSSFASDELTDEEVREKSISYLESMGYTQDALLESLKANYISEQLYNYITKDVAVTEEDVQAAYDELLASQQESFTSDSTYNTSRNNGETIVWNPEGYRQVKHVLIKFDDDQATRYSELQSTLTSLNDELDALLNPEPTEAPAETEAAEATAEAEAAEATAEAETAEATAEAETAEATAEPEATAEATEAPEETAVPRTEEEIRAEIANVQADLDALYEELMPKAQEVVDKFNAGTAFADLIAEYNEDPGMQNEPTATNGYAVSAESTTWDPAFTDGAMSIEAVGGISEPVCGQNGIHIIYYEADIPSGAVALDEVHDALESSAYETKLSDTYNTTVQEWIAAVNPVYHYDRLGA